MITSGEIGGLHFTRLEFTIRQGPGYHSRYNDSQEAYAARYHHDLYKWVIGTIADGHPIRRTRDNRYASDRHVEIWVG